MASTKHSKSTGPTTRGGFMPKAGPKRPGAKRSGGVAVMPQGSDLFSQVRLDAVNNRSLELLDRLTETMVSSAPSVHDAFRWAAGHYVKTFVGQEPSVGWVSRHQLALAAAMERLSHLSSSAKHYARYELNNAFYDR